MPFIMNISNIISQWPLLLGFGGSFDLLDFLILFVVACGIYVLIRFPLRSIKEVDSHWHQMFDTRPFSPSEFYQTLEKRIVEKGIEGLAFSTITHSEGGLLSGNRQYLRVTFKEYMMDICAAPFAKEAFFVSWWLGCTGDKLRKLLATIPGIGRFFNRREKTFYEQDTETMFKEIIADCVKESIEQLINEKGQRQIAIRDWRESKV